MKEWREYRKLNRGEFIVLGYDLAMGGDDYTALVGVSKTEVDTPIVYFSNEIATASTNKILPKIQQIYEQTGVKPVWGIEANAGGVMEIQRILNSPYAPYFTMYRPKTGIGTMDTEQSEKYGFTTNSATRPKMLEELKNAIDNRLIKIYDRDIINQLYSFIIKRSPSGWKPQAEQGQHDDLCFVAGTKILTNKGQINIEDLKLGDKVLTRKGYKPIIAMTNQVKPVITKYGLTGTPNHPIITKHGIKPLAKLKASDIIYIWNEKQSTIEEKTITDTQNQVEDNLEHITGDTILGKAHQLHYIGNCGLITLGKFLRDMLYTTKTVTQQIMLLITYPVFQRKNTVNTICCKKIGEKSQLKMGRNNPKGWLDNSESGRKITKIWLRQSIEKMGKDRQKERQKHLENTERVYNLEVEDTHEYFANNILVHNCMALAIAWQLYQTENPSKNMRANISDFPDDTKLFNGGFY